MSIKQIWIKESLDLVEFATIVRTILKVDNVILVLSCTIKIQNYLWMQPKFARNVIVSLLERQMKVFVTHVQTLLKTWLRANVIVRNLPMDLAATSAQMDIGTLPLRIQMAVKVFMIKNVYETKLN